eukprot:9999346-Prorocentrum_lima.AAC.1
MQRRVLEEADGDMGVDISTIYVLDIVWEDVAPGGQEELQSLRRCVRDPGIANTAEEALMILRTWRADKKLEFQLWVEMKDSSCW